MIRQTRHLLHHLSLAARLMLAVTLSFTVAASAALYLTTHYAAIGAKAELSSGYQRELEHLSQTIAPALLAHDAEQVSNALESLRRAPAVIRVGFRDVSDTVGFTRETPAILTAPAWFARLCDNQPMSGTQPLTIDGVYFGLLTLDMSPVPAINLAWERTQRQLGILALALSLVFVSIWLVLRHGLKPLQALAQGAQALSGGDFSSRLLPRGSPEVRASIDGFNRMAESIGQLVSEIQANNIALAHGEENLRVTLRSIGDAVITSDAEGRVVMMNPIAEQLTGWSLADARGQPMRQVFHIINEDTRAEVESPVAIVLREGRIVGLANHTLLVAKDGSERPIADSGASIRVSDDGETLGVVLVFRDQSAERDHFNAMRRSEALYASLADASPTGVFRIGLATMQVEYTNTQCREITGTDITGPFDVERFGPLIHADDRAQIIAQWQAALDNNVGLNVRFRLLKAEGKVTWVSLRTSLLRDETGQVTGLVATVLDITAEQEQASRVEHLSRLYATLSGINYAIVHGGDSDSLLPRVCEVAHQVGKFAAAWIAVADWDKGGVELAGAAGGDIAKIRDSVTRICLNDERQVRNSITATTLREGKRQISNDLMADGRFNAWERVLSRAAAVLGVPIRQEGRTVAALVLVAGEKGYFSDDIIALADEIGGDISYALDNFARERQRREHEEKLRDNEERLRLSLGASGQGSYEVDLIGRSVFLDAVCAELLGLKPEARRLGLVEFAALWQHSPEHSSRLIQRLSEQGQLHAHEEAYTRPDGSKRWLQWSGAVVKRSADHAPARVLGTVSDITEQHAQADHLRMTAMMFEKSRDAIIITDKDANILTVNPAFAEVTGYGAAEVIGKTPSLLKSGRHGPEFYAEMWRQVQDDGFWQGEVWNQRKNGEIYPCLNSIAVVRRPDGEPTHFLGLSADISKQKEFEERITNLAFRDPLTGLPNRVLLRDRIEQHLASALRENHPFAMLFLDLDHFKNINDSLGHGMGDRLLIEVGKRMHGAIRDMDTVGRLGGDEFLLALPEADADDAAHVAQKLSQEIAKPFLIDGHALTVTPSIGISLFPKDGKTYDELMRSADTAMYKAKDTGRNAYHFASSEMNQAVLQRLLLENNLRHALEKNEFLLYYQPQYEASGRRLLGMEALIRWRHPELGFIPPAQFIPVAEESGLIEPIGAWVLAETCRQIKAWQDMGLSPVRVGVNFSVRQFTLRNLLETVDQVLAQSGVSGSFLEVEITESLLAGDMDHTLSLLKAFKSRGLQISIDDFGTGYSSLSYLKRFPIDRLKIDQSFVRDLVSDAEDRAIAATVVALGHSLDMKVIAEGVETAEQLQILQDMGCDEAQGYLLGRPMGAADMTTLLANAAAS